MKTKSGVYGIVCETTGKWYVGASINVYFRLRTHFYEMKHFGPLYDDAKRYGIASMKGCVLELVDDISMLQSAEARWIEVFDSIENGYNQQSSRQNIHWKAS